MCLEMTRGDKGFVVGVIWALINFYDTQTVHLKSKKPGERLNSMMPTTDLESYYL